MGELIGSIGGLLIIALVILLIYQFFIDSTIVKKKNICLDFKKYLIAVLFLYLFQLLICGMIHSFLKGGEISLNNSIVWNNTIVFDKLFQVDYKYGFSLLINNGNMPIYYYLVSIFGNILFQAFDDVSLYLSFLCGITSYVILYQIINNYPKFDNKKDLLVLLFLIPGNIFLFIPTPFSVGVMFLLLFIYCLINKKNKILLLSLALLSTLFHLIGIAAIIILVIYLIRNKKIENGLVIYVILTIAILLLMIGILFGWNNWYENIPIISVCILFLGNRIIHKSITNLVKICFIILNSYLLFEILMNNI